MLFLMAATRPAEGCSEAVKAGPGRKQPLGRYAPTSVSTDQRRPGQLALFKAIKARSRRLEWQFQPARPLGALRGTILPLGRM